MPNVHCRVHNNLPLVPILGQTNSIHNRNIHFNIILYLRIVPNTFQSQKCALPLSLPMPNLKPVKIPNCNFPQTAAIRTDIM